MKYLKRYEDYKNSLSSLLEARVRDSSDTFVLSGTSSKFCITFELAWKVMKDILIENYGLADFISGSPRDVLKRAFKIGLIDSDIWLEMLRCRNNLIHDYDLSLIKESFDKIVGEYSDSFVLLQDKINSLEDRDI